MLFLAITLLVASAVLLALAIRGRTIARGLFCRRCKFDLAGLDPARPTPTCPECGRDLTTPKDIRHTQRRARPALAVVAACLALVGLTATLTIAPAVQAWLLPRVSDPVLVWLHRTDTPGANQEVLSRLSDQKADRSALRPIIERDLTQILRADAGAPAASERFRSALTGGRLSPAQAQRFFEQALRIDIAVRPFVTPDASTVPAAIMLRQDLPGVLSLTGYAPGFQPRYHFDLSFGTEQTGERAVIQSQSGEISTFRKSVGWPSQALDLPSDRRSELWAAQAVPVTVHARATVIDTRTGQPVATVTQQHDQEVRFSGNPIEAVRVIEDPAALARFAAKFSIPAPSFTGYGGRPPTPGQMFMEGDILIDNPQEYHIAYTVTVIGPDGQRIEEPNRFVWPDERDGFDGRSMGLLLLAVHPQNSESPEELHTRWAATDTVDIIFSPDLSEAYRHPMIDTLLAGEIIFRNVPLQRPTPEGHLPPPVQRPAVSGEPLVPTMP